MSFSAVRGMLRCGLNTQDLGAELNLKTNFIAGLKGKIQSRKHGTQNGINNQLGE